MAIVPLECRLGAGVFCWNRLLRLSRKPNKRKLLNLFTARLLGLVVASLGFNAVGTPPLGMSNVTEVAAG